MLGYNDLMTKLLDRAIREVRKLRAEQQDCAAEFLLSFAETRDANVQLTEQQIQQVERARTEVRNGKFATDEDMGDLWRRFGL